jgi:hypothetical protein
MSLRKSQSEFQPTVLPVAPQYRQRFIVDAHVIIAEGYAQLDPGALVSKQEPAISGMIVTQSRVWLSDPRSPEWSRNYFVTEEKYEDNSSLDGMDRPRIDIHIESSEARPRPRFVFEAKRLYRGDSVAEYVGEKGLGAFRDGRYGGDSLAAGMLGYVQNGSVDDSVSKVCSKLERERSSHGLAATGRVWTEQELDSRLGTTRRSRHARTGLAPIDVYHSFLKCCT